MWRGSHLFGLFLLQALWMHSLFWYTVLSGHFLTRLLRVRIFWKHGTEGQDHWNTIVVDEVGWEREKRGSLGSEDMFSPPSHQNKATSTEAIARFLSLTKFYLTHSSVAKINDFEHFSISKSLCCDEISLQNVKKIYETNNKGGREGSVFWTI